MNDNYWVENYKPALSNTSASPYLPSIHDSADPHGECLVRHLADVPIKEPGVGLDGVHGQGLHPGAGHQAGAWLVEGNVTICSYTCTDTLSLGVVLVLFYCIHISIILFQSFTFGRYNNMTIV